MLVCYCDKATLKQMLDDWDDYAVDMLHDWLNDYADELGEDLFLVDPIYLRENFYHTVATRQPADSEILDATGGSDVELIGEARRHDGLHVYMYRILW